MNDRYENTARCLQRAMEKENALLAALYPANTCHTREQLHALMDKELGELIRLKMQIKKLSKDAVLEGMGLDGVEYPSILWAEEIGPALQDFTLRSLHQQTPIASIPDEDGKLNSGKNRSAKRTVIYVVTAAGVILTINSLTLTPVNLLLLSMGIVITTAGLILLVKEIYFDKKALKEGRPSVTLGDDSQAEAGQIAQLLEKQLRENGEVIRQWNLELYRLVEKAIDKMEAGKQA